VNERIEDQENRHMEHDEVDFAFTFDFSTSAFTCTRGDCKKVVEAGARTLFVNGHQMDYCDDCIRSYLKEVVAGKTFTYSIHDNTPPSNRPMFRPGHGYQ